MNLIHHEYLQDKVLTYLGDDGELLSFFFDGVTNFLEKEEFPDFPAITVSQKRDFVFLLKTLDNNIRELGLSISWTIDTPEYNLTNLAKIAYSKLEDSGLVGLFCFYVLAIMFYGGAYMEDSEFFIDDTFPMDVFDALKPYVIAKKVSKEFSRSDVEEARKAVNHTLRSTDTKSIPPYAKNSYVTLDGKYYLVYDVLKGIRC